MHLRLAHALRRVLLEVSGWTLVVLGVILMPLPGPGLLIVFAGVALLAQRYEWAERRLTAVRLRALREAARSVSGIVSTLGSLVVVAGLLACGALWITGPPVPSWWPLEDAWWLPGGSWTGVFQIVSALVALGMMVYSYRRYHGQPGALAELEREIKATRARGSGVDASETA